jgi:threonylcarbamoyladenosine tRNA methylthiotransferase MtaB
MTLEVVTFGCRLNSYESELIKKSASDAGLQNTIIFNSCAVTKEAERQLRQAVRKAKRANPDIKIIVTGCAAQISPEKYAQMPEVDKVIGNEEKTKSHSYSMVLPEEEKILVNDIMSVKETASQLVEGFDGKTRAFLQVQNGCNHRCTFCIIPYGRGNSRSVPIGEIVNQTKLLLDNGYMEIVLTGVDITDYGKDLPGTPTLGQMVKRLLSNVPNLPRLRLSSIDVAEIDDELFEIITTHPRFMPHLHLSLQAGDNMILKRMKRRHSREQVIEFCNKVRSVRPEVVFGADIIAGFPTEKEEMFQNTVNIVSEAGLTYLHVFPYSEREGTPAARMPQVAPQIRKERAKILRELSEKEVQKLCDSHVGKTLKVLTESEHVGRTEDYSLVNFSEPQKPGVIIDLAVSKSGEGFIE